MSRLSEGLAGLPPVIFSSTSPTQVNLNQQEHAGRLVVQDAVVITSAKTFQLPKSTGDGDVYEIVNNAIQTQYKQEYLATLLTADTIFGVAEAYDKGGVAMVMPG